MITSRGGYFLLFYFLYCQAVAKTLPADNGVLTCTQVYFESDFVSRARSYKLSLCRDSLFSKQCDLTASESKDVPAFLVGNLQWGAVYYWKITAFDSSGQELPSTSVHKFRIVNISNRNFAEVRLRVLTDKKEKRDQALIALDNTRTIFNHEGTPVWTMPLIEGVVDDICQVRDIKPTPEKTLTFITDKNAYEIDFTGRVLWKGLYPFVYKNDTIAYHHDLKKDRQGNYFVLGKRFVYRKLLAKLPDDVVKNEADVLLTDSGAYRKTEVSLLAKFDKNNKLLWLWDANDYLSDEDLNHKRTSSGFPNFNSHTNAFSINRQGTYAYVGFRDLSRIVKIDMATKKVVASYGEKYPSGEAKYGNGLFKSQHDASITERNTLFILNNNGARGGGVSSVIEFRDQPMVKDSSLLFWKMTLDFDALTNGKSIKGGNVMELPNKNLLVCAGELNRVFEVSRSREITWDAFIDTRAKDDTTWQAQGQYRANRFEMIALPHFMARQTVKQGKNSLSELTWTVYNTGNVADNYLIEIVDDKKRMIASLRTKPIKEGNHQKLSLKIPGKISTSYQMKVTSLNYPWLVEVVNLSFNESSL